VFNGPVHEPFMNSWLTSSFSINHKFTWIHLAIAAGLPRGGKKTGWIVWTLGRTGWPHHWKSWPEKKQDRTPHREFLVTGGLQGAMSTGSSAAKKLICTKKSTIWLWLTVRHGIDGPNLIEIDGLPINSMVIFHGYVNHNQMVTYINCCCFWIWCPPGIAVVFLHPSWHRWTSGISTTSGRHRSVHCSRSLWSWDMVEELCGWFTPKFGRKFIYIIIYIWGGLTWVLYV